MPRAKVIRKKVDGFLPVGMDLDALTDNCRKAGLSKDRILLFFKYIINGTRRYDEDRYVRVKQYVEMHIHHLEKIFGANDVSRYKKFLIDNNYIETQNYHIDQGIATRYRIVQDWFIPRDLFSLGNPMDYYLIRLTDTWTIKAEEAYLKFRTKEYISRMDATYLPVVEELRTLKLEAETPAAKEIVSKLRTVFYKDPFNFDEVLRSIQARDNEYYVVCKFGYRFHTVWSSLLKKLRPLVRFTGHEDQQLLALDIVNSQPWLTTLINKDTISRFTPEAAEELKHILSESQDTADWTAYKKLCIEGGIYERWMEILEATLGGDWKKVMIDLFQKYGGKDSQKKAEKLEDESNSDRDVAKVLFFIVIFGKQLGPKNKAGKRTALPKHFRVLNDIFMLEWPNAWQYFSNIKLEKFKCNPSEKKGGHSNLSMLMQRIESTIMKQLIVQLLGNGINKFVPIYDGTLHLPGDIDLAIETAYDVIDSLGLPRPKIGMENPMDKLNQTLKNL